MEVIDLETLPGLYTILTSAGLTTMPTNWLNVFFAAYRLTGVFLAVYWLSSIFLAVYWLQLLYLIDTLMKVVRD